MSANRDWEKEHMLLVTELEMVEKQFEFDPSLHITMSKLVGQNESCRGFIRVH
jgi:hypothetical protein